MKRRTLFQLLSALVLTIICCTTLTSCYADDYWPFSPPPGWGSNYFYDSRLDGTWVLTQYNATPVSRGEENYMEFNGNGHGRYYYYQGGQMNWERMGYFCQRSASSTTSYQINVQYEDGSASTMTYWFSNNDNVLWLQWRDNRTGDIVTYMYEYTNYIP